MTKTELTVCGRVRGAGTRTPAPRPSTPQHRYCFFFVLSALPTLLPRPRCYRRLQVNENAGDGDAEAASSLPTELVQAANLKLAPGDEIFFSDPVRGVRAVRSVGRSVCRLAGRPFGWSVG